MVLSTKKVPIQDKVVPDEESVLAAHRIIDEYFDKDGAIVVHCYNGVNRTGYVICTYLCKRFGIDGDEAMRLFAQARGHQIEYDVLVQDLKTRYRSSIDGSVLTLSIFTITTIFNLTKTIVLKLSIRTL